MNKYLLLSINKIYGGQSWLLTCNKAYSWNIISQKSEQEQNLFPADEQIYVWRQSLLGDRVVYWVVVIDHR